ncbi:AarF domain-containing protein kinase 1 [Durusdinium trenchii]|uniref:AarF domain-containing protein kinase 1 n=1 Tax=Durusdinium trenchii TaxID=1381693 RepID=A0ABP0IXR2_9DINO
MSSTIAPLLHQGQPEGEDSDCTVVVRSAADCWALAHGQISPQQAFAQGHLSLRGSLSALMQVRPFLAEMRQKLPVPELPGVPWLPDSASNSCMACDAVFTMMRRRHHCRSCGQLFCDRCSPYRSGLDARQCDKCRATGLQSRSLREDVSASVRLLEQRLEEVEAAAAQREAEELLGTANAFLCLLAAASGLLLAAGGWRQTLAANAILVVVTRMCFFRQLRALWLCVLVLWKYMQSTWEAKRLCEEDAKRFLSARYRVLAFLGARGLRQLGGVWPKVGQYMSTQGDKWPDEVLAELRKLRDAMPAAPFHTTKRTIEEDLGKSVEELFQHFEEQPIASASIGQVHKATLRDGRLVAVKVQHRHAARQIPIDVAYMRLLARFAWVLTLGEVDLMPVVTEWLGAVLEELDFQNEAKNQIRGRTELLEANVDMVVPEVFLSLCGRRVLVMEFVEGHQVAAGDASLTPDERLEVMTSLVKAYAHGLFVSGHFNGDPHAGNLLVTRRHGKAKCVLLDWGLTKQLSDQRRLAACKLIVSVGMKDTNGIVEAFREMGMNFSANADPEPELLLAILRQISLIENKQESRRMQAKFGETTQKAMSHKMELHTKVDSYTGDFFFIFRVASLIKGLATVLDIKAQCLEIFISVSRGVLAGRRPQRQQSLAPSGQRIWRVAAEALQRGAVGIQVAKVDANGQLQLSLSLGCVSYTSWQPLHESDPFPLGCTVLGAPLFATAVAAELRKRGIALNAPAKTFLWSKYSGPLTVGDILRGTKLICKAPPQATSRMLADLPALMKWLESAPAADGTAPAWWPSAEREAACAWLLKGGRQSPSSVMKDLFSEVRRPMFRACMSPIQISKPIMSVESAEVEAAQDSLVASLGADEMRAMHLTDVCLANHPALRDSERSFGQAASAASAAAAALHVKDELWDKATLSNQLSCAKRSRQGELAVVFLTCADADLALQLAELALET